ncbi:Lactate utilization protein B [Candidatus Terasakiella magnetica]|uniref:Lactate utilization protein B n=1 Tax=Candidatus Terasakiella magnetica TaxID=1867952 RepID=A0A1C3RGI2_9PROT|nr:LutB/LldF family L-lactate oxidation iron-sulfur protein [Candidatus Terasakiella magnetica]SCA56314.1 Lactate utilization protein B [Candidatus Terasakiella magnetica]
MELNAHNFKENAKKALDDQDLQSSLKKLGTGFPLKRLAAKERLPEFEELRDQARDIKDHTLRHLDYYLERFETRVEETGGKVHWARDVKDGRNIVYEICKSVGAKTVTKGKSMIGEEMALNEFLEEKGLIPVETDLGEYIIQLRGEPPSHIIAPAIHLRKSHVEEAFRKTHTELPKERNLDAPEDLLKEARAMLREKFLAADVGITGANFMVAETGSTVIVTNEGNGDLTQTLPRVHIVLCSIEKVVPNLEDCTTLLRVLARSATGQEQSVYTTFSTGPRGENDPDGPDEFHVVILDNGRSRMVGHDTHDMLRCIRCSACINHCPVYQSVGGHAYGSIYPGPMGSVLTPALHGLEKACDLPNASTMCGKCEEVCPVRIPIPRMLRSWRQKQWEDGPVPFKQRLMMSWWAFWALRPKVYHKAAGLKMRLIGWLGRKNGHFKSLPMTKAWTKSKDFPAPEGKTFQQLWSEQGGKR